MKYAIVIPDGAADFPVESLEGRTPLEAAAMPCLDRVAAGGRQGTVATTPEGFPCGSDVCTMSLLGYDPRRYHRGRAPLEAAALGLMMEPTDWIFRVNLITVVEGIMQDHSAGHIRDEESRQLLEEFASRLDPPDLRLHPGVSYRHIMMDVSGRADATEPARDWSRLATTAPHDIPGEPIRKHLPAGGEHAPLLQRMIAESEVFLADHEINQLRREMGELPATHLWPWGQGRRPEMPAFADRFGPRGAMITAVDLLAGLARMIGWDRLDVPNQSSYHDNDYDATGRGAVAALEAYDLICAHVESPDEAAHAADPSTKIAALEAIDERVIGPIHEALESRPEPWRLLILPDHYTRLDNRKHDPTPVPFLMAGERVPARGGQRFSETHAHDSDLHITHGHDLMEYFLRSG